MRRIPGTRAVQRSNAQRGDADAVLDRLGARRFRSLDAAFNRITRDAALLLDAARISIWLFSGDRQRVNCVHAFPAARVCGPTLAVARYPQFVQTLEKTGIFFLADAAERPDDYDPALADCLEQFNVGSMLVSLFLSNTRWWVFCATKAESGAIGPRWNANMPGNSRVWLVAQSWLRARASRRVLLPACEAWWITAWIPWAWLRRVARSNT